MAKRRLTKQQSSRISSQQARLQRRRPENKSMPVDNENLGSEQYGRVVAHMGQHVIISPIDSPRSTHDDTQSSACHVRANVQSVVVGDEVVWQASKTPEQSYGVVLSVLPRHSELSRPDAYGHLKPMAANVDNLIITLAIEPEAHANLIDRYLAVAAITDLSPVIVMNKIDLLSPEQDAHYQQLKSVYTALNYRFIEVSVKKQQGLAELRAQLDGRTSIFVGQSGVGKSSILRHFLPEQSIKVGELSSSAAKGKHTTTRSNLYTFKEGGMCIDSPGIREFGLWHLTPDNITFGFSEINEAAQSCKFRNCQHRNEPGCAVKAALEKNTISHARFTSYQRILLSLDDVTMKTR